MPIISSLRQRLDDEVPLRHSGVDELKAILEGVGAKGVGYHECVSVVELGGN